LNRSGFVFLRVVYAHAILLTVESPPQIRIFSLAGLKEREKEEN